MRGASKASPGPDFKLEQLEPRVLLSADNPLLGEVARLATQGDNDSAAGQANAHIQQLDAATSAEISAASGADFGGAASAPSVSWGSGWQTQPEVAPADAIPPSVADSTRADADSNPSATASISETVAAQFVVSDIRGGSANAEIPLFTDPDILASEEDGFELPRGPPEIGRAHV